MIHYYYDWSGDLSSDTEGNMVMLCEGCADIHAASIQLAQSGDDDSVCELCDATQDDELTD